MISPRAQRRALALLGLLSFGVLSSTASGAAQAPEAVGTLAVSATKGTVARLPAQTPIEARALRTLVDAGVRPALGEMASMGGVLASATQRLCAAPDVNGLQRARNAWRQAYAAWRRAEPFLFGPIKALQLDRRIGFWPANTTVLEAAVASDDLLDLLLKDDARGYAAAEYLLFHPSDPAAATADGRCAHLYEITMEIADLTAEARRLWEQDYEHRFLSAGDGEPFLLPGDALSLPFAEALNLTERMLRDRIGHPSGLFDGQAKPERLEAWHSGSSREGLKASLEGLRMLVIGDGEAGVANLVATRDGVLSKRDPKLAADLRRRLDKALAALADNDGPLHEEVSKRSKRLRRLYREVERLQEDLVEATLVLELNVL